MSIIKRLKTNQIETVLSPKAQNLGFFMFASCSKQPHKCLFYTLSVELSCTNNLCSKQNSNMWHKKGEKTWNCTIRHRKKHTTDPHACEEYLNLALRSFLCCLNHIMGMIWGLCRQLKPLLRSPPICWLKNKISAAWFWGRGKKVRRKFLSGAYYPTQCSL